MIRAYADLAALYSTLALTEKALGRCADQLLIAHAPQEPNAPTDRHQEQFPSGASMKDQGQGRRWDGQGGQQER